MRALALALPLAILAAATGGMADAALIHDYNFDNGLTDSVAGGVALSPSFRGGATGVAAGGLYTFDQGAGLQLGSQLPGQVYTIEMRVSLAAVSGYRKLVSFENLSDDRGLYILNSQLDLFNVAIGVNTVTAGSFFDVRVSRDAGGNVTGFLNGVSQFTYADTGNVFTAATNLYFLRDDLAQNGEDSGGVADFIRIYDTAEPTATAVPEPATWGMMLLGFGLVGAATRRRVMRVAA